MSRTGRSLTPIDRAGEIAPTMPRGDLDLRTSYDRLAEHYAEKFEHELAHKPFDREQLTRFADRVRGQGRVCDLGCGPGQIARSRPRSSTRAAGHTCLP